MVFSQFKSKESKDEYLEYLDSFEKSWPVPSKNYYIDTTYGSTFIREVGKGEPVVLLPGKSSGAIQYKSIIKELSKTNKVYAIDIVGDFGRSFLSKEIETSYDYADWQHEVYSSLGIKDFTIIGISMGAWISSLYASKYDGAKNLILISPVATMAPLSGKTTLWGILSILLPFTASNFMKKYFKDLIKRENNTIDLFENEIMGPINIVTKCFKSVKPQIPQQFNSIEIESIKSRVLYLVGENEVVYNTETGVNFFRENFKSGSYKLFKNAGHDLFLIEPNKILEEIYNWL